MTWFAVCSNKHCQWKHRATSWTTAQLYAHDHVLKGPWAHRVAIVQILDPAVPAPPDRHSKAA